MAAANIRRVVSVALLLCILITFQVAAGAGGSTRLIKMQLEGIIKAGKLAASRLQLDDDDDESGGCWNALVELKSCTNEIILFFLNGDTYLTMDCCRAIRIITYGCWPSMLTSLGFTSEEADILRGYCGGATATAPPSLPQPPAAAIL